MLNADELGEKGESRFKEICADAKLICNKSDRDRTGWDFIVEFPFPIIKKDTSLDSRPTPISCHIQVKTLQENSEKFSMRLSSAERLAKETKPTFIYILKCNSDLKFTKAFLVHIIDDPLAKILKRLRKEESKNSLAINKKTISMSIDKVGIELQLTGSALRRALEDACGLNLHDYISNKEKKLKKLGFESHPYQTKLKLHLDTQEDIIDAFLGLKKDIHATNFNATVTRFGIKLPAFPTASKVKISFSPNPIDHCTILIRRNNLSTPSVFKGELFAPPLALNIPIDSYKLLVKSDFFSIALTKGKLSLTFNNSEISTQKCSPEIWASFWGMIYAFSLGEGTVQISPEKTDSITFSIDQKMQLMDPSSCERWIDVYNSLSHLFKVAGALSEHGVTLQDVEENATRIISVSNLVQGKGITSPISFATSRHTYIESIKKMNSIYVDYIALGEIIIVYGVVAEMIPTIQGNKVRWQSDTIKPRTVKFIKKNLEEYNKFIEIEKAQTKIENVMSREAIF